MIFYLPEFSSFLCFSKYLFATNSFLQVYFSARELVPGKLSYPIPFAFTAIDKLLSIY